MKLNLVFLAASLATVTLAAPATAQDKVCLQNNRIWSWDVINQRTLLVEDVTHKKFVVHLSSGCVGLDNARLTLAFKTSTSLGCMAQGDKVLYREPALGRMSCIVEGVDAVRAGKIDGDKPE